MDGRGQRHPSARELLRVHEHVVRVQRVGHEREEGLIDLTIARVPWGDPRASALRDAMNAETSAMYEVFTAGNSAAVNAAIDDALSVDPADIVVTILVLDGETAVGHAALRPVTPHELEVKKVFVSASHRGRGISRMLMLELERILAERGGSSLVLQTGPLQVAAIALYESLGYQLIPPFGKYGVIANAVCYRKVPRPPT